MKRIRVLIVDDSATIRRLLATVLARDEDIEVVGGAPDAATARQMIKDLTPDVVTLDVEMPNMNGIDFLEKIMRLRPMPVVMVSTLTQKGAEVTLSALEIGAVDCFAKPTENIAAHFDECARELCEKVRTAAGARVRAYVRHETPASASRSDFDPGNTVVAIGSSTGGVEALIEVLSHFPKNCPATVITQHMPPHFTTSFAERLNRMCQPTVTEARDGAVLTPGQIYLAPGGDAHLEIHGVGALRCRLVKEPAVNGHRPSVDVLFSSVAATARHNAVGVILTGMGRDGASGLLAMRKNGASTIGQDEASSVVYGMPRVAYEIGAVERQFALHQIGQEVLNVCELRSKKAGRHAASI